MLKKILEKQLAFLARRIIAAYEPQIVCVTGSVGKTSAREAITRVLQSKLRVRQNRKNYNNEIGIPLSIIGVDSPGSSLLGWWSVFLRAAKLILFKDRDFPEVLVLEMGIDRPGDMAYLTSIVRPDVAVVTNVGQSHIEFFGSEDNLGKEKGILVRSLKPKGFAILNSDDERVRKMEKLTKARVLTYGFNDKAQIKAMEIAFSFEKSRSADHLAGLSFKMKHDGSFVPVHLPKVIGYQAVYAGLAAASVARTFGFNLVEISQALIAYESPRGRMRLIPGDRHTMIIDDTYNASPQSTLAAIDVAGRVALGTGGRRWAIIGEMLELGSYTEAGHQIVGQAIVDNRYDYLVCVGERALIIGAKAKELGFDADRLFHFSTSTEAKAFVKMQMKQGDLLLIKGSQGARMERIVKEIMAEPLRAKDLLVRQDWPDA